MPLDSPVKQLFLSIWRWFDTTSDAPPGPDDERHVDWLRVVPFIGLHVTAIVGLYFVGWSWVAVGVAALLYAIRMFAITGFYHRYFSHKTFRTSRPVQFVMALVGASSVQRGPLWWAAHHRNHHRHSDTEADVHSPVTRSFWYSHMGWFLTRAGFRTDWTVIPDLRKFWELKLIDRFDVFIAIGLAWLLFWLGGYLQANYPELGTSRAQMLIWGFFISTVVLFHCTVTINSLAHRFGRRRYRTRDESRNNWFLALITFGEGWHNNHHHFPGSARQGFYWWEFDMTYYGLKLMSWLGLVWDLKAVPNELRLAGRIKP